MKIGKGVTLREYDRPCVDHMSQDIGKVVSNKLENKCFTFQVGESRDFTNKCHSLAFVNIFK